MSPIHRESRDIECVVMNANANDFTAMKRRHTMCHHFVRSPDVVIRYRTIAMMMIFDDDDQHDESTHHDARFPAFAHSFAFEFPFIVSHAFAFVELELAR